jgi:hypothetical protein
MNQALVFGLLGVGGLLLVHAVTGSSFADILQGHVTPPSTTGAQLGVAGVGSTLANVGSALVPPGLSGSLSSTVNQIAADMGWDGVQANAWLQVIQMESGGSMTAKNPSSGAYGIAQFINGPSEYAQYGGNVNTQQGQLTAMANYIKQRYGTPSAALAHENTYHWY